MNTDDNTEPPATTPEALPPRDEPDAQASEPPATSLFPGCEIVRRFGGGQRASRVTTPSLF